MLKKEEARIEREGCLCAAESGGEGRAPKRERARVESDEGCGVWPRSAASASRVLGVRRWTESERERVREIDCIAVLASLATWRR